MTIAILGASGFIGQNLVKYLQKQGNFKIKALCINPNEINYLKNGNTELLKTDIFNKEELRNNLKNAEVVYYLIHMMAQDKIDFYKAENLAANNFIKALDKTSTKTIIYLSGLGRDSDKLSKHLLSRHNTGKILAKSKIPMIEFRASMVIGEGSIGYETIKRIVHKLPVIIFPKGFNTHTQPIGLGDALNYLYKALFVKQAENLVIEIGGPEKFTYKELFEKYARFINKTNLIITKVTINKTIAKIGLGILLNQKYSQTASAMVDSLNNDMVVTNSLAIEIFPEIKPKPIEKFFS